MRAAKGPEQSGGTQLEDLVFLVGSGRRSACAMVKCVPPSAHAYYANLIGSFQNLLFFWILLLVIFLALMKG